MHETRNVIEEKVVGILLNRPELLKIIKRKGGGSADKGKDLGEVLSSLTSYYEQHASLDISLFLNVLEKPELREKAVRSAMDVAEYDEWKWRGSCPITSPT